MLRVKLLLIFMNVDNIWVYESINYYKKKDLHFRVSLFLFQPSG